MEKTMVKKEIFSIGNMSKMAIFAAISGILMLFKFPIPLAPNFMTIDFSDVATLISGFILGPISGAITVILKNIINLMLNGTTTAYVGELSNTIIGITFVVVSSLVYKKHKDRKHAVIGLVIGILLMTLVASLSNYFFIFPLYARVYNIPLDGFTSFLPEGISYIGNFRELMLFAVVPFNIIKGALNAVVTFLIYKKVSVFMKSVK